MLNAATKSDGGSDALSRGGRPQLWIAFLLTELLVVYASWRARGLYRLQSLVLLSAAFTVLCVLAIHGRRLQEGAGRGLRLVAFAAAACQAWLLFDLFRREPLLYGVSRDRGPSLCAAVASLALVCLGWTTRKRRRAVLLLLVGVVAYGLFLTIELQRTPRPAMDVWSLTTEAADELLAGRNPYEAVYTDIYAERYPERDYGYELRFIYLPGLLLHSAPFRLLGQDVRTLSVVALAAGLLLFSLAVRCLRDTGEGWLWVVAASAAAMFWYHGGQAFLLEHAWPEGLILLYLCLAAWTWERHPILAGVLLGLAMCVKQTAWFVGPFLGLAAVRQKRWRLLAVCAGVGCALALPFFAWDPLAFVDNCLLDLLRKPPRADGLSWAAFSLRHGGAAFGFVTSLSYVCYFGALALLARSLWRHGTDHAVPTAWLAAAAGLLGFFLFLKQSFFNYYYLVGGMLAFYPALAGRSRPADLPADSSGP